MLRYRIPLSLSCCLIASLSTAATADPYPCTHEKATIRGCIRDVDGAPAPNATVGFEGVVWDSTCRHGTSTRIEALTDRKGSYFLRVPSCVGSLRVMRSGEHYLLRYDELFKGDMVIDYRFVQHRIRGRILAPDSVQGEATVMYYPDPGRSWICGTGLPEVQTSGRTFDVAVNRTGRYVISAQIRGSGYAWTSLFVHSDTTLTLNLGGDCVFGRVHGYAGLPLKQAFVFASGLNATTKTITDSAGHFQMRLPAGSYRWSVEPRERDIESWVSREEIEVEEGKVVDLDIDAVEWTGTARFEGTDEPVPDLLLCVEEEGRQGEFAPAMCVTDRYGDFRLMVRRGVPHRLSVLEAQPRMRQYPRVRALRVDRASSSVDSTFDIGLERLWVPEPPRVICPSAAKSTIGTGAFGAPAGTASTRR